MNRKIKDALTLGIAAAFVLMFALWSICKSDDAVSESERRPLKQFPTLNVEEVLSGRFQSNFESYTLDQFPLRDEFRTLKALSVRDLFGEKDNNGIYVADGYAAKLDDTIHEDSLDHAADRFRYVYETYLKDTGANVSSPSSLTRITFWPPKTAIPRWITRSSLRSCAKRSILRTIST